MIETADRSMNDAARLEQVTQIVSSYVAHNALSASELPKFISETHSALKSLATAETPPAVAPPTPAVPIKKSVTPDFIVCLEDGRKFKSMKRHLSQLGMTPEEYRAKWGLPADYPMVAPSYSATRSSLARTNGLGRKPALKAVGSVRRTRKPKAEA